MHEITDFSWAEWREAAVILGWISFVLLNTCLDEFCGLTDGIHDFFGTSTIVSTN